MIDNEILAKVFDDLSNPQIHLKTNFSFLDCILCNIEKGSLITIGARPSMGKTSFMTTILLNLLEQNKKCLFFSLDMNTALLIKRLIVQHSEIYADRILDTHFTENDWNKITNSIKKLSEYDLTIYDEIFDTEKLREEVEQNKPDYVFIDYLQLFEMKSKRPRTEILEKVMFDLKKIAKDNNCMIFVASQLSRALETRYEKRPYLSDLRESGAIENISDVVMFVYRDEYYDRSEDNAFNKGKAEIIVAKNKYGPACSITLLFRSPIMKFLEPKRDVQF